jgi:cobalt-zinc-cadmium efflux system outer membrane protein
MLTVGLEGTRLVDGSYSFGPNASIEVPLFDQRQALVARLEALEGQSEARLQARAVEARSEVRTARGAMVSARRVADRYRTVVVPLRERIVALAQQRYDAMLLGAYELLLAKDSEVNAYRDYIDAVRDYWVARSDLERAVGGRLAPWPVGGVP